MWNYGKIFSRSIRLTPISQLTLPSFSDSPRSVFSSQFSRQFFNHGRIFTKLRSAVYGRTVVANARYRDDVLNLQAMSLTYSTLLSLVPFLAVMFSVLKAFEVQNVLEPFLTQMLQPLGQEASQVANRIINFVVNIRVGILGAVGVAMLFYTVVTLVAKV